LYTCRAVSARHHREVFPTELSSDEDMERDPSEWRRINVLYECDWMNVCYKNMKNKQKEWHHATKPLKKTDRHGRSVLTVLGHTKMVCTRFLGKCHGTSTLIIIRRSWMNGRPKTLANWLIGIESRPITHTLSSVCR
jgi:hypothetical protein